MVTEEKAKDLIKNFLQTIISEPMSKIKGFIEQNWDLERIEIKGIKDLMGSIQHLKSRFQGVEINKIFLEEGTKITALLQNKTTDDWFKFAIWISEEEPYFIKGMGVKPSPPPVEEELVVTEKEIPNILDSYIDELVKKDLFSGVVVIAKDDEIIYSTCQGFANKSFKVLPNLNTKYNLGSMNKMFTALSVAKLVQEGKLSFEDTVAGLLPESKIDQSEKIKVHHLLTHTSGLGNFFSVEYMKEMHKYKDIQSLLKLIEKEKLQFEPGERFEYSNSGFEVLAMIIEKISETSYYDFVKEHVFSPAGMINTDSYWLDEIVPNLAVGYTKFTMKGPDPTGKLKSNIRVARNRGSAAGGGYSTANDLINFGKALFSHKILDEEHTIKVLEGKVQMEPESNAIHYAYGFGEHKFDEIIRYGHNGGAPGINTFFGIYKPLDYIVIVLSNLDPPAAERVGQKIQSLLLSLKK